MLFFTFFNYLAMEDIEVPTEHLHEKINEQAKEQKKENKWSFYVAISTAFMAVFAAIASSLAGHHSNEAVIDQIKASDQWAYYQAKGIKAEIIAQSIKSNNDSMQLKKYNIEQQAIKKEAEGYEKSSKTHLEKHVVLARSVTLFQIAIAISAIAILSERRFLWLISIVFAAIGIFFFVSSFL